MSFLDKLLILCSSLWVICVAFLGYNWLVQYKTRRLLGKITKQLATIGDEIKKLQKETDGMKKTHNQMTETIISIDKDEPLSKYETVTLPDEIDINFVDKNN